MKVLESSKGPALQSINSLFKGDGRVELDSFFLCFHNGGRFPLCNFSSQIGIKEWKVFNGHITLLINFWWLDSWIYTMSRRVCGDPRLTLLWPNKAKREPYKISNHHRNFLFPSLWGFLSASTQRAETIEEHTSKVKNPHTKMYGNHPELWTP